LEESILLSKENNIYYNYTFNRIIYITKNIYLISGSPKCPFTGLKGGELGVGILLSLEKQLFSIVQ